jgi:hypothetical protein
MRVCQFWAAAILVVAIYATAAPTLAQRPPQSQGDPREPVALSPVEAEKMLTGMRTYLETIQGIVAALAENDMSRIPALAMKSGAKMLEEVAPTTGLKTPIGFAMLSFDTHDKFDKLADKAAKGSSRSELLTDLRNIMGNCISCHASYRLAP